MRTQCALKLLAESRACEVWICEECGTILLTLGPMSLRLHQDHFLKTVEILQQAVRKLGNTCHDAEQGFSSCTRSKLQH
ncbi:MAG: hypothetical protein MI673_10305 [Thiotrichales bacterium]|nr:hypothetical protein [Thiotrichales bacterium]